MTFCLRKLWQAINTHEKDRGGPQAIPVFFCPYVKFYSSNFQP